MGETLDGIYLNNEPVELFDTDPLPPAEIEEPEAWDILDSVGLGSALLLGTGGILMARNRGKKTKRRNKMEVGIMREKGYVPRHTGNGTIFEKWRRRRYQKHTQPTTKGKRRKRK